MIKVDKKLKLKLAISLIKYFFSITSLIIAPIFFIIVASEKIPSWMRTALIYIVLPALAFLLLRFFYKRKLKKVGLDYDPLNVQFFSMGKREKLIDRSLNEKNKTI